MSELKEHAHCHPGDDAAVKMVIKYLQALNNMFERGILGNKVRVFDVNGSTIQRMENGFNFFSQWMDELVSQGIITIV